MRVDSIKNGFVIDHITAGNGMNVYNLLGLDSLDISVALIKNAPSEKMGKKDIIKIDADIDLNLDVLGFADPGATVNVIKNSKIVEKKKLGLPETITDVAKCKNPRCITSTEQEIHHVFKLTDREKRIYRCVYCESQLK